MGALQMPWRFDRLAALAAILQLHEPGLRPEAAALAPYEEQALDIDDLRPKVWSKDFFRPSCELPAHSGKPTGVCTPNVQASQAMLTFCGDITRYRACVPAEQKRWPSWNGSAKDKLLSKLFKEMVEERMAQEMNVTPDVFVEVRYLTNPKCVTALKNVLCWYNFPKCDDDNRSLPLCQSSCEQYYHECGYKPNDEDGLYDFCRNKSVTDNGIFESGSPGPDQALAKDNLVCRKQPSYEAMGFKADPEVPAWYTTWWGSGFIAAGILILVNLVLYCILPVPMRLSWVGAAMRILYTPVRYFRELPLLPGKWIVWLLLAVVVSLIGVGIWRQVTKGFGRFPEREASWREDFKPKADTWGFQAKLDLTNPQLEQLQKSCSCTGAAHRVHMSSGTAAAAIIAPLVAWAAASTDHTSSRCYEQSCKPGR
mmetsp:Transcript_153658/g.294413  ORF Transcript_153658/g.294413 Transcript_153658/m.294413 type:complete len:425 (-) Transcript_153658:46-1320(-)